MEDIVDSDSSSETDNGTNRDTGNDHLLIETTAVEPQTATFDVHGVEIKFRYESFYEDITLQFADVECFFISAESLIFELAVEIYMNEPETLVTDFMLVQSLVIITGVERFLNDLKARGGRFILMFSEELMDSLNCVPGLQLVIQTVYHHLMNVPEIVDSIICVHLTQEALKSAIDKFTPSFVMLSSIEAADVPDELMMFNNCLKMMQVFVWLHHVKIVTFVDIEISVVKIMAYVQSGEVIISDNFKIEPSERSKSVDKVCLNDVKSVDDYWTRIIVAYQASRSDSGRDITNGIHSILLASCCLADGFPLSRRVFELSENTSSYEECAPLLRHAVRLVKFENILKFPNLHDLFDGRLIAKLQQVVVSLQGGSSNELSLPSFVYQRYVDNCKILNIESLKQITVAPPTKKIDEIFEVSNTKVLKLTHPIIKRLGHLISEVDFCQDIKNTENGFIDRHHWHSDKLLDYDLVVFDQISSDSKPTPVRPASKGPADDAWREKKRLKAAQAQRSWMESYGQAIEGASRWQPAFSATSAKIVDKPTKQSAKAKEIVSKNEEKRRLELLKGEVDKLNTLVKENSTSIANLMKALQSAEKRFDSTEAKLKCGLQLMIAYQKDLVDHGTNYTREVVARRISSLFGQLLSFKRIVGACTATDNCDSSTLKKAEKFWSLLFPHLTGVSSGSIFIDNRFIDSMPYFDFYLLYGGESVDLVSDPVTDRRVPFTPDKWQRDLLNIIDHRQSALIVAPTSSGKTFLSYYCMEKILRASDDDLVVYVAPTKALVQQVAATVYHRFKNKQIKPGKTLFGVFTRDYRENTDNCQILITVPQCLLILLLGVTGNDLRKRLRYVIFDEVHCVGVAGSSEMDGNVVWEHIISFSPCPFLALSATVSNPDDIARWLRAVQKCKMKALMENTKGLTEKNASKVEVVSYAERYSELQHFIFDDQGDGGSLHDLHPYSLFSVLKLQMFGIPNDLRLTAKQVYTFYTAMISVDPSIGDKGSAAKFFDGRKRMFKDNLDRTDLREFEEHLKSIFIGWLDKESDKCERVIAHLKKDSNEVLIRRSKHMDNTRFVEKNILNLVENLRTREMLPALVFSDNRMLCSLLARLLIKGFENKKMQVLELPENKKILKTYEKQLEIYEKAMEDYKQKLATKKKPVVKKGKGDEDNNKAEPTTDPEAPTPPAYPFDKIVRDNFSLEPAGVDSKYRNAVFERILWKDGKNDDTKMLIYCLENGIGYHHSGMTTAQRQAVMFLYATGYLKIVFCTATLALGIHMPCRTVVFGIDSPWLTPLQYRQMAGRAGRRGFDKTGNVVFYGLPTNKIRLLFTAVLPKLRGNEPFTSGMVLRMLLFMNTNSVSESSIETTLALIHQPLVAHTASGLSKTAFDRQMEYRFLFACQFLTKMGFCDETGNATGEAAILSHLHYHEPGNFAFVFLLRQGIFEKLHKQYPDTAKRHEIILTLLATLFTRIPISREHIKEMEMLPPCNSKVFLPELPNLVIDALQRYNDCCNETYQDFMKAISKQKLKCVLPFSKTEFTNDGTDWPKSDVFKTIASDTQDPVDSITGITKKAHYARDGLARFVQSDLCIDKKFIPTISYPWLSHDGKEIKRNGYALDFYRHGILSAIQADNKLGLGDCWYQVKDFMLMIKAIRFSIQNCLQPNENDPVFSDFMELDKVYSDQFSKINS